jgi:hypothetical protein
VLLSGGGKVWLDAARVPAGIPSVQPLANLSTRAVSTSATAAPVIVVLQ